MSTLPKSRLRIAGDFFRFNRLVDQLRPSQTNPFDEEIPFVPRFHGADSLQVEVAVFNDGVLLDDLSAITGLELVIKPLHAADPLAADPDDPNPDAVRGPASNVAPIACKRIDSEHFNPSLTELQWQSKAADMAHAVITLDSEEAALSPGERWLSLIALGADGEMRTLAAGAVLILGGGPTFNALPQPVVKDLRDQAAQSAAAALQSADNAASKAQQAASAVSAAQEQVTLAAAAATQAGNAVTNAQQAATEAAQARDAAQQFSGNAESSAQAAQQTANRIGDLDAALIQAANDAERSQTAAAQAEASELAAAAYAAATNPNTKETASGIDTAQAGGAEIGTLSVNDLAQGGTQSFTLAWAGRVTARGSNFYNTLFGSTRGITSFSAGSVGLAVGNTQNAGQAVFVTETDVAQVPLSSGSDIMGKDVVVVGVYDAATQSASLYVDGVLAATADWSAATLDSTRRLRCMLATTNTGTVDTPRSPSGIQRAASAFTRALTPAEIAGYAACGGKIVPVSARADCALHLTCDDGAGYQLRDSSGNGNHALLSAAGCTHLKPGERFSFTWSRISSGFLGDADRPVLPVGAVIEQVIWEDAKGTRTTASLGSNASSVAAHVASFTPTQERQPATLAAGSMAVTDRRLYLDMSANAGAVTVHVRGRIL